MERGFSVRGLIVGEGPDLQMLRERAQKMGVDDRIVFTGYVEEPMPYVRAMDIFALPSLKESLPLTSLEAMANSRPVVATAVGDMTELIRDGENGLIVPPGNAVALADRLENLIMDEDLRARLSRRARQTVIDSYSAKAMSERIMSIYDRLIGEFG